MPEGFLDKSSKIAGLLTPLLIALIGGVYTYQKDRSDNQVRQDQYDRNLAQTQYANLTALLPLLLSKDPASVSAAINVYTEETKVKQAPVSLQGVIEKIGIAEPSHRAEVELATQGAAFQVTGQCKAILGGLFIEVPNDIEQLNHGKVLAAILKEFGGLPFIQGVQRVDAAPAQTQLRYYFSADNDAKAATILKALQQHGFPNVQKQDLTQNYLKSGCPPPPSFELWIGSQATLGENGQPK